MFSLAKKWWAAYKRPSDPLFKRRPQAKQGFGNWLLVELGATEYVILQDTLHSIHIGDSSIEQKGREILGLRYQALAMSSRTKGGKIPLDWRSEADLMWLAHLPYSEIVPALQQIAVLSDIPWLNPVQSPKDEKASNYQSPVVTAEEIAANP
jgi:hypothetical protein